MHFLGDDDSSVDDSVLVEGVENVSVVVEVVILSEEVT